MLRILPIAFIALLAGCAPLPPSPQDIQAKQFESLPDKAVVYIVRSNMDSMLPETIWLDDHATITTHPRTYYRWEAAPGTHRIAGFARSNATITLRTEAGKIYFVEHTVQGIWRTGVVGSFLRQINEQAGRALVNRSELL